MAHQDPLDLYFLLKVSSEDNAAFDSKFKSFFEKVAGAVSAHFLLENLSRNLFSRNLSEQVRIFVIDVNLR